MFGRGTASAAGVGVAAARAANAAATKRVSGMRNSG